MQLCGHVTSVIRMMQACCVDPYGSYYPGCTQEKCAPDCEKAVNQYAQANAKVIIESAVTKNTSNCKLYANGVWDKTMAPYKNVRACLPCCAAPAKCGVYSACTALAVAYLSILLAKLHVSLIVAALFAVHVHAHHQPGRQHHCGVHGISLR